MTNHLFQKQSSRIPRLIRHTGTSHDQSKTHEKKNNPLFCRPSYIYSILLGDNDQTRRYAKEIAYHEQSTVKIRCDGSIIIQPYSRQLPNEIITLIFLHLIWAERKHRSTLFECALVSKQFYANVNPLLYKILDFRNISSERFFECLSKAPPYWQLETAHYIRELYLHGPHWKDALLTCVLPYLRRLKHLSIDDDTLITDKSFKRLPYRCPHLTFLRLDISHLTKISFSALAKHCRQLAHLHWNIKESQSSEWLEMFKSSCPIKHLQIKTFFKPLHRVALSAIKTFHQLTSLDIMDMNSNYINEFLQQQQQQNITTTTSSTRRGSTPLSPLWPYLTKLTLYPCNQLDDSTIIPFIKSHSYLEELYLMKATRLTDRTLEIMTLPNLTEMALTENDHITTYGVRRMIRQCTQLDILQLPNCLLVPPSAFPELWELHEEQEILMNRRIIERIRQYIPPNERQPITDEQRRLANMAIQQVQRERERQRAIELHHIQRQIQQRESQLQVLRQRERQLQQQQE